MFEKAEREKNLEPVSEIGLSDTFNMFFDTAVMVSKACRLCGRNPAPPV